MAPDSLSNSCMVGLGFRVLGFRVPQIDLKRILVVMKAPYSTRFQTLSSKVQENCLAPSFITMQ